MEENIYYSKDGTKVMIIAPFCELESIVNYCCPIKIGND